MVLGKGAPGGSWHRMDPNLRTLSLSAWMSLPGYDFHTWEKEHQLKVIDVKNRLNCCSNSSTATKRRTISENSCLSNVNHCDITTKKTLKRNLSQRNQLKSQQIGTNDFPKLHMKLSNERKPIDVQVTLNSDNITVSNQIIGNKEIEQQKLMSSPQMNQLPRRTFGVQRQESREVQTRALVSHVAEYYEDYVKQMNLSKYFCNDTIVTSVRPIKHCENGDRWMITGIRLNGKSFVYTCKHVVLANGTSDLANRLGLRGENFYSDWIKHDLPQLESALEQINDAERSSELKS